MRQPSYVTHEGKALRDSFIDSCDRLIQLIPLKEIPREWCKLTYLVHSLSLTSLDYVLHYTLWGVHRYHNFVNLELLLYSC